MALHLWLLTRQLVTFKLQAGERKRERRTKSKVLIQIDGLSSKVLTQGDFSTSIIITSTFTCSTVITFIVTKNLFLHCHHYQPVIISFATTIYIMTVTSIIITTIILTLGWQRFHLDRCWWQGWGLNWLWFWWDELALNSSSAKNISFLTQRLGRKVKNLTHH